MGYQQESLTFLNGVFLRFDALVERLELEKIKTMGDAYMVVGGGPNPQRWSRAERIAEMALDMQEEVVRLSGGTRMEHPTPYRTEHRTGRGRDHRPSEIRFMILWGDTVDTASRMEAVASPETIQVTAAVYERLKGSYQFEGPTAVLVKGKGELLTYRLAGEQNDFAHKAVGRETAKPEVPASFVGFSAARSHDSSTIIPESVIAHRVIEEG